MDNYQIKEKLGQGYFEVRAILEVVGNPKGNVTEALKSHLKKIKADKNYIILKETIEPPMKQDNFFSAFAELELLIKNSQSIIHFCFDYMPGSIEILSPEKVTLKSNDYSDILNDMQARLHAVNTGMVQLQQNNTFYIKNTAVLLRNFIVVLLSSKPMSVEEMQPFLGVKAEDIEKVANVLIKEAKIKKQDNKYVAIPK